MKNKLAICAIFKDEELYVEEWLEFHYLIGVRRFYIYLNNCNDDTLGKIKSWKHSDLVDAIDWPMHPGQLQAYQHCINRKTEDEWIAFIDSDEFLHSRNARNIIDVLDEIPSCYTTVVVNWLIFGSNNIKDKIDKPVIETFTKRAEFTFPANRVIKSIIRNNNGGIVRSCHFIETTGKVCYSDGSACEIGHDGIANEFLASHLVLNHYFTKSHQEWIKKKLRGRATISNGDPQKIRAEEQFVYHDRNEVEDLYLYDFVKNLAKDKNHLYIDSIERRPGEVSVSGWAEIDSDEITSLIMFIDNEEVSPCSFIKYERMDVLKVLGRKNINHGFKALFKTINTCASEIKFIAVLYRHKTADIYTKSLIINL